MPWTWGTSNLVNAYDDIAKKKPGALKKQNQFLDKDIKKDKSIK